MASTYIILDCLKQIYGKNTVIQTSKITANNKKPMTHVPLSSGKRLRYSLITMCVLDM